MNPPVKLRLTLAAVFLVAIMASAAFAATNSSDSTGSRPTLKLASETPLTIAGHGFARGESVSLSASVGGVSYRKTVKAGKRGGFTTVLSQATGVCVPLYASAVGRSGSRAAFRRRAIPGPCGIDPAPGVELDR